MKPMTEQHLAMYRRHMVEVIEMHFDLSEEDLDAIVAASESDGAPLRVHDRENQAPAKAIIKAARIFFDDQAAALAALPARLSRGRLEPRLS